MQQVYVHAYLSKTTTETKKCNDWNDHWVMLDESNGFSSFTSNYDNCGRERRKVESRVCKLTGEKYCQQLQLLKWHGGLNFRGEKFLLQFLSLYS